MKITITFHGRQSGAIGIFYKIQDTYNVSSISEARSLLYEDYEHIDVQKVVGCTKEEFNSAEFIPVRSNRERKRKENGSYYYTRDDSMI